MADTPFFSLVVCTRNRPDVVQFCLLALKNQSFKDFEVILSDNSDPDIRKKNGHFIESFNFKQLKYAFPDRVLNMHEHYNFALNKAKGQYIGVLTDKNLLKKDALRQLHTFLKENQVDIINYRHGDCKWFPEKILKWTWEMRGSHETDFEFYNPTDELLRRFSLTINRSQEDIFYNFGKIFFGFYSRQLIERMKEKYKEVFHYPFPDYSSAVLALEEAKTAAFCHKELMIAVDNYAGNGQKCDTVPKVLTTFLESSTDDAETLLNDLPIPHVYTVHNLCAYDYQILNRFGCDDYQINLPNLAQRVYEDLQTFPFADEAEKETLWGHFNAFVKQHNLQLDYQKAQEFKDYLTPKPKLSSWEKCQAFMRSKNKLRIIYNIIYNLLTTRYISLYSILK